MADSTMTGNFSGWGERSAFRVIDKSQPRIDGPDKVTGRAQYTHDVRLPGMLYGRVLTSPYAHARITALDVDAANGMAGVKAVVSFYGKELLYEGDPVAAVAATTPEIAEDAIRAITVTYSVLPHAVDPDTAMSPSAPLVHPEGNVRADEIYGALEDVQSLFGSCAAVAEGEYRTAYQHHACLETHGVVVDYTGGDTATIYASTQGTFSVPNDAADELSLLHHNVRCIVQHMGGGFGAKMGLDLPGMLACRLALQAKRPVHLMLTRADDFLTAGNRSASLQLIKLGAAADGTLVAITAEQHRLGGLGEGSQAAQPFIYNVEHVYRTVDSVYMNIDSSRAFRAPGCPQASFPMETLIDDIAAKLNLDPIEIRKKNTGDPVYARQLDLGAEKMQWAEKRNARPGAGQLGPKKRGMGCGLAQWGGGGFPACDVVVGIAPDGTVSVSCGTQDLGTGTRTYMAAIAAEELGLPISAIQVNIGDSRLSAANGSGGSTTTPSLAPAVKHAADQARFQLKFRVAPLLGGNPGKIECADGHVGVPGGPSLPWNQACAALGSQGIETHGEWMPGLSSIGVHGVQFAEVEVDTETGKVQVLRMLAIQDCGLPLNRLAIESQLNGGMIQGLGYALYEQKITDRDTGHMMNPNMEFYKLPGSLEMPEFLPIIDDSDDRGVIGMAEPGTIPAAGAIGNAVFNACGVRVRTLPITPDKILDGLHAVHESEVFS